MPQPPPPPPEGPPPLPAPGANPPGPEVPVGSIPPVGQRPIAQAPVGVATLELAKGGGPGAVGTPPGALGVRGPEDSAGVLGAPGVVGPPCPPAGCPRGAPGPAGGTWPIVVMGHEVEPPGGGGTCGDTMGPTLGLGPGALLETFGGGDANAGGDIDGGTTGGGGMGGGIDTGGAPGGGP